MINQTATLLFLKLLDGDEIETSAGGFRVTGWTRTVGVHAMMYLERTRRSQLSNQPLDCNV